MAKKTIKQVVQDNLSKLKSLNYVELIDFGKKLGYDNRQAFSRFKKAVASLGINFEKMKHDYRGLQNQKELEEFAKNKPNKEIVLFCDYKAKTDRFAVTTEDGNGIWYGKSFEDHEQSAGELATAKKAIWLAVATFELNNVFEKRQLHLYVDAQWLTYGSTKVGNRYSNSGGKALALSSYAKSKGIYLKISWVPGAENPADDLTIDGGYCKARDNMHAVEIKDI